jgi:hypothetical protein
MTLGPFDGPGWSAGQIIAAANRSGMRASELLLVRFSLSSVDESARLDVKGAAQRE